MANRRSEQFEFLSLRRRRRGRSELLPAPYVNRIHTRSFRKVSLVSKQASYRETIVHIRLLYRELLCHGLVLGLLTTVSSFAVTAQQRMLRRHPLLQVDIRRQRSRRSIRSAHKSLLDTKAQRNHIRVTLSAGEKFNSLLEFGGAHSGLVSFWRLLM